LAVGVAIVGDQRFASPGRCADNHYERLPVLAADLAQRRIVISLSYNKKKSLARET
jgi:hypothetical protein